VRASDAGLALGALYVRGGSMPGWYELRGDGDTYPVYVPPNFCVPIGARAFELSLKAA